MSATMDESPTISIVAVTAAVGAVILLFVLLFNIGKNSNQESESDDGSDTKNTKQIKKSQNGNQNGTSKSSKRKPAAKYVFTHPFLAGSLKSHSSPVLDLDFSPNGKYLASCSEDRVMFLWNKKDFNQKEHKSVRVNVEFDHAKQVKFSPDNRALILSLGLQNTVRVLRIGKKSDGGLGNFETVIDFPKEHKNDVISMGIASTGRYIMTCSNDTLVKIWNLKGEILDSIDTKQGNNSYAAISPCGRFVASSGFTPDVKVWEVCFDKSGGFLETKKSFQLKGHTAGVYSFAFNTDSSRMASLSKDNTWKLWDTNIEYQKGQEPYLLKSGDAPKAGYGMVALSPNGRTIALGIDKNVYLINAVTGYLDMTFDDVHTAPITCLIFDAANAYLLSTGDKNIQVFHNVTGYQATIDALREQYLKSNTAGARERIQTQIDEAKSKLAQFEDAGDK